MDDRARRGGAQAAAGPLPDGLLKVVATGVKEDKAVQPPSRATHSEPPECPGCRRTMRLVGRESHPEARHPETLTFECDCGQIVTATTNQ
jgi:hypothetical protein